VVVWKGAQSVRPIEASGVVALPGHFKDSSAHALYSAAVIIFYFHIASPAEESGRIDSAKA
jgi:hypothetical protein